MASGNILYPGYYPGQPVIRSPRGGRPKYNEYTYGAIDEYLNQFDIHSADIGAVPRWVWERAWKEVEASLEVIDVTPENTSYEAGLAKEFPREELQELPGVGGISFNLNPADWIKDPGKQVKKTLKGWSKAVFSFDDFSARVQKEKIWDPLISGYTSKTGMPIPGINFQFAKKAEGDDLGRGIDSIPAGSLTPLQLSGLGVTYERKSKKEKKFYDGTDWQDVVEDADAFEEFGVQFKDFTQKVDSSLTRYGSYSKLQMSAVKALDASLKKSFGKGANIDEDGYIAGHYKSVIVDQIDAMVAEGFLVQAHFAGQLEGLSSAQRDLSKALEKLMLGVGDTKAALENVDRAKLKLIAQLKSTDKAIEKLNKFKSAYGGASAIPFFRNLNNQLIPIQSSLARMSTITSSSALTRLLDRKGSISGFEAVQQAKLASMELVAASKGMFGGDILTGKGLGFLGGQYEQYLGKMLNGQVLSRSAFSEMLARNNVIGGKRLTAYLNYAAKIYSYQDFKDIVKSIEGGKYLNLYGWTLSMKMRFKYLTPGYYTELFMKKMHYFGLAVQSGSEVKAFKIADKLFKSGLFANKFKLMSVSGGVAVLVQGGRHFDVPLKLFAELMGGGFGKKIEFDAVGNLINIDPATMARFFAHINEKFVAGMEITGEYDRWIKGLGNFKTWLMKDDNYKKFGIAMVNGEFVQTEENFKRITSLFRQLQKVKDHQGKINPTVDYIGLLQRLSSKLNAIQNWLFNSKLGKILAKYVSALYYLKTTIAEAVAGFVTGLLAIGTEGIGAIIGPIVDRLVKYVVIKILDFGEMILKAVFKLDFSDLGEMLEKGFNLILKTAGLIFLVFGLAMVGVIFVITTVISAIPPSDPVKGGDFFVGGTNSENGFAENEYIAVNKDVTVTYKDASGTDVTLDNPESIPAEAVDGSGTQVKYVIKIHAKSDVKSIEYKDTVTYSPAIGSSEIQTFTSSGLTSIKGNEDLIINLPATDSILLNDGKYKNTMIINTITIKGESEVDFLKSFELSATRNFIIGEFSSTCPLMGGSVSTGSYDGWAGDGHGTNGYWRAQTKKCFYAIPYLSISTGGANSGIDDCTAGLTGGAACAPSSSTELCNLHNQTSCSTCNNSTYHRTPKQPYYGYAADIVSGDDAVYAPQIPGVLGWKQASIPIPIFERARGYGVLFVSDDSQWLMYLGHINEPFQSRGDTYGVGEKISDLFTNPGSGWKQHVHVELSQQQADGYIPIKPESLICK